MNYRNKLYIAFISFSAATCALAVGVNIITTRKYLFEELQNKVTAIAATTASLLNGDVVAQIRTPADEQKPAYREIQQKLKAARDANRRKDIYIKYMYTVYLDPGNPHQFIFGVDPEENAKDFSPTGSFNRGATDDQLYEHLFEPYSFGKLLKDPWGTWMTGYAPIYDSNGKYVATVGADLSAALVHRILNRLITYGLFALLFSLAVALIIAYFLAEKVTRALKIISDATIEIGKGDLHYRIVVQSTDEFGNLAVSMNEMVEGLEEKERLKTGFAHYVSNVVLDKIVKTKGAVKLEGERRKVTVFFSDIHDFTRLAETMPPEQVVVFLNDYFKTMIDIIFKYNGMIDKLIGDGIMAEFGAPTDDPEQEKHAVMAGIQMMRALTALCEKWKSEGKPTITIGIGIHTGEAIVGSIGSEQKMEYTAIGDTVNIASRLESITKNQKYSIVVSESTFRALHDEFPFEPLGPVALTGRERPINAYAILMPELSIE